MKGKTMTAADIATALTSKYWTRDELEQVRVAYNFAQKMTAMKATSSLRIGCKVTFFSKTANAQKEGVVVKINRKTVKLKVGDVNWTVSPQMLTVIE